MAAEQRISTVISAFNSLTLSPALAAVLLKGHDAPKDRFQRGIDAAFGWLFRPFNRFFASAGRGYVSGVQRLLRGAAVVLMVYGGLLGLTALGFKTVPEGFVPQQDLAVECLTVREHLEFMVRTLTATL